MYRLNSPRTWFVLIGVLAIISGGLLSAFMASEPSRTVMWVCAYFVLVIGVAQVIFGCALDKISEMKRRFYVWAALVFYNVSNVFVVIGSIFKQLDWADMILLAGGIGLSVSLTLMLLSVKNRARSWHTIIFYIIIAIIMASIPIGLWLSGSFL